MTVRAEAQLALGQMLLDAGDGAAAWESFAAAARAHDARALNMLGRMSEQGWNGLPPAPEQAAGFYRRAAAAGSGWAHFNLGDLYLRGAGVPQDDAAAYACYTQAAAAGVVKALNMIGMCHEEGRGTPADPAQARRFFVAGAEGGDCWAQFNLGRLALAEGQVDAAAAWFEASLATGFPGYWRALAAALAGQADPRLQRIAQRFAVTM
ncbi:tetratricopeptide repeat protein [Paenirhodobacter sp.]|uniref:tetratricopeptide repeat protein n=1 Tax=Paenirhodobacter sp. TaxID=1965326 RepID=UPI003B3C5580